MTQRFVQELKKLKSDVLDMANLSKEMLNESIEALKTQDVSVAEKVISQRKDIRVYDNQIEDDAKRLIALYQPVAKDLRTIITILKMNTYLTRIGIYSKDISRDIKAIPKDNGFPRLKSICLMGDLVLDMLDDVIKAYETEDLSLIEDMGKRDDTVDDLFFTILRECISYMIENPNSIGFYTHYMLMARYLERCGDHVCKISEKLNYMITGERIIIK